VAAVHGHCLRFVGLPLPRVMKGSHHGAHRSEAAAVEGGVVSWPGELFAGVCSRAGQGGRREEGEGRGWGWWWRVIFCIRLAHRHRPFRLHTSGRPEAKQQGPLNAGLTTSIPHQTLASTSRGVVHRQATTSLQAGQITWKSIALSTRREM
jgi:hypothetical protein